MRKNNNLLEMLESLEKKVELKNSENISNLAITYNSSFSWITMCAKTLTVMGIFMLIKKSYVWYGDSTSTPLFLDFDLTWLFNNWKHSFFGLGAEFIFCIFFIGMLYTGKAVYDEWNKDINNIEHIKKSLKILNLKDSELKSLTLKNLQMLKNILEQQNISVDEKQIVFEFLFEMHKMF